MGSKASKVRAWMLREVKDKSIPKPEGRTHWMICSNEELFAALKLDGPKAAHLGYLAERRAKRLERIPKQERLGPVKIVRPPSRKTIDWRISDAFLESYEWRALRMKVLTKYGRKCMCCGATPENGVVMNVDHIKPRRKFPELALEFDNLQVLCNPCNHGKGNWDETDWRPVEKDDTPDVMALLRDIAKHG